MVVGAVIYKVVDLMTVAPLVNRAKGWLRDLNRWRRCRIGNRRSRADTISQWKAVPPKLLRRTVFRWYKADPQAWCENVSRIQRLHKSRDVRAEAEKLLWDEKRATDLVIGDRLERGHVLDIIYQDEQGAQIKSDHRATTMYGGNPMVKVARGWCHEGPECPDCKRGKRPIR